MTPKFVPFFHKRLQIFGHVLLSSRSRHTRCGRDWSSDVCSSDLAELERALGLARSGRAVLTIVRGPSGIGKTALVRTFVEQLVAENRAVVLSGRCYVRESMPYKGLDGVIDSLTRFLRTLPDRDLDRLITRDLATVLQLFPVLGRVPKLLQLPAPERDVVDPVELRRQRFSALQGLFRRIAAEKPVVVHIDDLQWGDAEDPKSTRLNSCHA